MKSQYSRSSSNPCARVAARWLGVASLAGLALATGSAAAAPPQSAGSGAEDRKQVGLTVYNQNFGLVREVRELANLPAGQVSLEFRDVAATIQPETVHIRSLDGGNALRVLEQNYRYDLLTPQTLLEKYVGKDIRVYRYHAVNGKEDVADARLLSVANGPVLSLNGEITFDYGGRFGFPKLPDNLIAKPTLMWLVDSQRPKQKVEVSYLAQNLSWKADYVLVLDEKDQRADLTGWVTLTNNSGTGYENAELKLVAGDVNRVAPEVQDMSMGRLSGGAPMAPPMREESFLEYHLYTLARPTTVLNNEQKQVTLLEAKGAGVEKRLIYDGQDYFFRGQYPDGIPNQKVGVYLDLQNSQKNGLGMPLPKGIVRVYKADKSQAKQFVGEDQIDHTARDERVRIKLGDAFDVVAERKQTRFEVLGNCASESGWEVEFRNQKDTAIEVIDNEPVGGDWTIVSSTLPAERKDARTFVFNVKVPARGKTKVSYVVRVRWC